MIATPDDPAANTEQPSSKHPTERQDAGTFAYALFDTGVVVATPAALKALGKAEVAPSALIARHTRGDWGAVPEEDARENERSVRDGFRVLSAYVLPTRVKVWIITEADRSSTCLLLPEDY